MNPDRQVSSPRILPLRPYGLGDVLEPGQWRPCGIFRRARRLGECVEASAIPAAHLSRRILKGHGTEDGESSSGGSNDENESTPIDLRLLSACPSKEGAGIAFADLTSPSPAFVDVSQQEVETLNPLVAAMIR
jgi:hypothetical protein